MSGDAYLASEDSGLLRKGLDRFSGETFLEIGAGNCGILEAASRKFMVVVGTDIARPNMGIPVKVAAYILADAATPFADRTFDLVAFNPPYLSSDGMSDTKVDAGPNFEVALRFLREALRAVKEGGRVLFLLSGDAPTARFEELCTDRGFSMRKVDGVRLFFEEVGLFEAERAAL